MPFDMDKVKSKNGASVIDQKNSPYLIEVQCDISDLPFAQYEVYQY